MLGAGSSQGMSKTLQDIAKLQEQMQEPNVMQLQLRTRAVNRSPTNPSRLSYLTEL